MGYDAWKTESDRDYHERMGTHRYDVASVPPAEGGRCACGVETMRSVAGTGWQCKPCGEAAMRAVPSHDSIYQTAIRLYWAAREAEDRKDVAEGGR